MEDKRKQDLEDEMNRFEQEIAGNLPPPPKVPSIQSAHGLPHNHSFIRPIQGMSFPGPPPPMPPPMFGHHHHHHHQQMDVMQGMPSSMPTLDGMHPMPPLPPGLPGLPPMMGMTPQMMGMGPPMGPGPGPSNINPPAKLPGKIAPPTVPLKNYEIISSSLEVEVEPEEPESINIDVVKETKQKKPKKKSVLRVAGGVVWEDETLLEWEVNDFRIFVGDLGNEVSDDALLRAFSRYPSLLKAKVVRDKKTKKTKGFGFVSFKDPQDYLKAMREMNGKYVGNRPIKLRKSSWKDRNIHIAKKKEKEKKKLGLR